MLLASKQSLHKLEFRVAWGIFSNKSFLESEHYAWFFMRVSFWTESRTEVHLLKIPRKVIHMAWSEFQLKKPGANQLLTQIPRSRCCPQFFQEPPGQSDWNPFIDVVWQEVFDLGQVNEFGQGFAIPTMTQHFFWFVPKEYTQHHICPNKI